MGRKMMSSMHLCYAVEDWGRVRMSHRYQAALEYNDIAQEWNSRKRAYQRARKSRQKIYSDEGERRRTAPIRCRTVCVDVLTTVTHEARIESGGYARV